MNSLQIISPPLNTVVVDESNELISTTAIRNAEWKRKHGTATNLDPSTTPIEEEEEDAGEKKKLERVRSTKDNCPPIIVAALGQEHKFGRWIKDKNAKNGALVIPLLLTKAAEQNGSGGGGGAGRKDHFRLV